MTTPSEQTVMVTGANGYVALHVVREALEKGYYVRGTARSESSAAKVLDIFPEYSSKLSMAVVPDITKPESYEAAFAGASKPITGIMSVAAPFAITVEDNARDLLDPAIRGAVSILEATRKYGSDVRRVVNTSSFAAIVDLLKGARPGYKYTEKDWNEMTYEAAVKADGSTAYCVSKSLAEKTMWEWVEREKPHFTLVSINPPWVFGPHVTPIADINHLNESSGLIWRLYGADEVPAFDFGGFADVRVVATAHIKAFEEPKAGGQRFLVGSKFSYQTAADNLREEFPHLQAKIPEGTPGHPVPEDVYLPDGSKAEEVLGIRYIPLAKTMKDSFEQLLDAQARATVAA